MDKKALGEKVKQARIEYSRITGVKFTQQILADTIKVSRSYIGDIESGRTYPTYIVLEAIAKACDVPLSYFNAYEHNINNSVQLTPIPILGIIRAGEPILACQNIIGYEYLPEEMAKSGHYFGLKVVGDSMNNSRIYDGDTVLVRCQEEVSNGEIAVVLVNGENATIKKFFKTDTMVTLMPDSSNKEHQPKFIDTSKNEVRVLGKVIKAIINL